MANPQHAQHAQHAERTGAAALRAEVHGGILLRQHAAVHDRERAGAAGADAGEQLRRAADEWRAVALRAAHRRRADGKRRRRPELRQPVFAVQEQGSGVEAAAGVQLLLRRAARVQESCHTARSMRSM